MLVYLLISIIFLLKIVEDDFRSIILFFCTIFIFQYILFYFTFKLIIVFIVQITNRFVFLSFIWYDIRRWVKYVWFQHLLLFYYQEL